MKPGANYERVFRMTFASVYPHCVTKVEKKGRTMEQVYALPAPTALLDPNTQTEHPERRAAATRPSYPLIP